MSKQNDVGHLKVDAETLNAVVSAMGALAMCISRALPPDKREDLAHDMVRLARNAEEQGDTLL